MLFALVGLCFVVDGILRYSRRMPPLEEPAYYMQAYFAQVSVNLACLLALAFAGLLLFRLERRGFLICNWLFSFEIVYFLALAWGGLSLSMSGNTIAASIGESLATTAGTANMGLSLQLLTAYPVIALLVLNLLRGRLNQAAGSG